MHTSNIALGLVLSLIPAGLAAQTTAPADDMIIDEGQQSTDYGYAITVTGQSLPIDSATASVAIVTAAIIERDQDITVSDALSRLPGVNATRNGPVGGLTSLRIRGADASQTLVVIDGVKVGDPSSPGGGFDFGSLLTGSIDRIEVLRGSNSVAWGSDAIGGVVLIDTVRPGAGLATQASAEYGSHDTARANARIEQSFGPVSLGIGAGYFRSDGISSAAVGTEADGYRQYAGNAKIRVDVGSGLAVFGSGYFADSRLELDGFPAPLYSFADTDEYQKSRETYLSSGLEHDLDLGSGRGFSQRLTYSVADINRDTYNPAFGTAPGFIARGRSERITYQGDVQAAGAIRLQFGGERETSRMATDDGFSGDAARTRNTAGYAQLIVEPVANLTLNGGLRHDDHRDFGGQTSLSAGLAWVHPESALKLRASFAEGYKAPTLFQLSGAAGAFGNPELQPEESRSYDIGLSKGLAGDKVQIDVSAYRRDSRNLIDFISCPVSGGPAICATGNRPFGTYSNIARARAQGIEVDVTVRPIADDLAIRVGYAITATRDRTPGGFFTGNRLSRRPIDSGIISVDYGFKGQDRSEWGALGVDVRYVGVSFDDRGNGVRLDDYALVTVRGKVNLTAQAEVFGRVENLFSADYQSVGGYGTYGRTFAVGVRGRF